MNRLKLFVLENGQGLVEYALILTMCALVLVAVIGYIAPEVHLVAIQILTNDVAPYRNPPGTCDGSGVCTPTLTPVH
jgi:Flp pilus assembly pilin Flp